MGGFDMVLELALLGLLGATLLHAIRLRRALGSLRHDRAALHDAVVGFDTGTRQAEAGLARLREMADHLAGQLAKATSLRDDLAFLSDRGESVADRLDTLVRAGRAIEPAPTPPPAAPAPSWPAPSWTAVTGASEAPAAQPKVRSQAERNLLAALQSRR